MARYEHKKTTLRLVTGKQRKILHELRITQEALGKIGGDQEGDLLLMQAALAAAEREGMNTPAFPIVQELTTKYAQVAQVAP